MVLFHQLLHVLRCRATGTGFVHAATGHQWHDRQHLGAGAEFHDREQIGQVVAQDVAGDRDRVKTADRTLHGVANGTHLRHDLNVQTARVVVLEVDLDLLDQFVLVRTVRVEPEHRRHTRVTGARHRQLDPVTDRCVLGLTGAPDVARFHVQGQQHFAGRQIGDIGHAVFRNLEGLVVRTVLFGLLRHQPDIGHRAHGARIEIAIPLAEVDHLLVDAGKGALRHHGLDVLQAAVGAPHLAAIANHGRHGSVDDDVIGRMEIGNALGRIHHRQFRAVLVAGVQVADDFLAQRLRQRLELVIQVDHAVVDVHAEFFKQLGVFCERILVEDPHAVTEHDRVRDLHHGGLDVQREHDAGLVRVFNLFFIELKQGLLAHEHAVDNFAVLEREFGLEHQGLAALGEQFHLDVACLVQRQGLLAVIEVAVVHVRDVRA